MRYTLSKDVSLFNSEICITFFGSVISARPFSHLDEIHYHPVNYPERAVAMRVINRLAWVGLSQYAKVGLRIGVNGFRPRTLAEPKILRNEFSARRTAIM